MEGVLTVSKKSWTISAAKAVTWRLLGATDTFVLTFLMTGKCATAVGIVGFEVITKSVLYVGHERAWIKWGV